MVVVLNPKLLAAVCFCYLEGGIALAVGQGSSKVSLPTFVFPEDSDAYFGKNVNALKASLDEAIRQGCLKSWPLTRPTEIAVVFRHDSFVPETSDFYIQYQMEQVAASQASGDQLGFKSFSEELQYKKKLAGAVQVWEWSPRQLDYLNGNLIDVASHKINYVPLWSSVDVDDAQASCVEILDNPACEAQADVDVLFFGAMTEARKKLCKRVDAEMSRLEIHGRPASHECISGVFGAELECKICKAKVIYSDHSRPGAVLEVHRINPLLTLGKAVVSANSADKALDSMYDGALKLTSTEEIPEEIASLLLNDTLRFDLEQRAYALSHKMKLEAQSHVCRALHDLSSVARDNASSLAKEAGLQDYVPYSFNRRLLTANMSTSSNSSNSSNSTPSNVSSVVHLSTSPPTPIPAWEHSPMLAVQVKAAAQAKKANAEESPRVALEQLMKTHGLKVADVLRLVAGMLDHDDEL